MGSNSIRLVIYAFHHNEVYRELHNFKVSARLSNHIDKNGEITKDGINIIINTMRKFSEIISSHEITEIVAVATAALRNAKNRKEIIEIIQQNFGINFRILNEYEEAYYGYVAVVNSTNIKDGVTIDIGGGSTEITLFQDRRLIEYHSFPFGVVSLKNQFIQHDPPTKEEIEHLTTFLERNFRSLPWLNNNQNKVIGIGGTARNLSKIHQRKINYPLAGVHQYEMTRKDVEWINELLSSMSSNERLNVNGLSKDRTDIILPGILTFQTLLNCVDANKFIVSKKGLRDGLFFEQILNPCHFPIIEDVTLHSLNQWIRHFQIKKSDMIRNFEIAKTLYEQIAPFIDPSLLNKNDVTLLQYSSYVFNIGTVINEDASSEHTFYLLTNSTIDGLNHEERLAIAFIASFKSRGKLKQYYRRFSNLVTKEQLRQYEFLGAILKLANAFDRTRRNVFHHISVTNYFDDTIIVHLQCNQKDPYFEVQSAQKQKKHLEKIIQQKIELQIEHCS